MRLALVLVAVGSVGCTALEPGDLVRIADAGLEPTDAQAAMDGHVPGLDSGPRDAGAVDDTGVAPLDGGVLRARRAVAGGRHTCAIVGFERELVCWGARDVGQLGPMARPGERGPLRTGLTAVLDACAGDSFTCTVHRIGPAGSVEHQVRCFGANDAGQLGPALAAGEGSMSATPVPVGRWRPPVRVECGARHACASDGAGALRCWGDNGESQIVDTPESTVGPVEIALGGSALAASLGEVHSCAIVDPGSGDSFASCWGSRTATGIDSVSGPTVVMDAALHVAAGRTFTCAGDARSGSIECRAAGESTPATRPELLADVMAVDLPLARLRSGDHYACAASADRVVCWGAADEGQVGAVLDAPGANDWQLTVDEGTIVDLTAGRGHVCAVTDDGAIRCWGRNDEGQVTGAPTAAGVERVVVSLEGVE